MPKTKPPSQRPLPYATPDNVIADSEAKSTVRYDDVYYEYGVGKITRLEREGSQTFIAHSEGKIALRLEVWSDDIVRIRFAYDGEERPEYARDPDIAPRAARVAVSADDAFYTIATASLSLKLKLADASIAIQDKGGYVLHEFAAPFYARYTLMQGLEQMRLQFRAATQEGYYGLGDKAWDTDLHGRCLENWCSDAFAYGRERDALYRAIPFCYGLRDGRAYGLFLDNHYRSHFDFNSRGDGLTTIWTDGGPFDYYFINGPKLDAVARRYVDLTGTPELPPLWALGYHQCRWSYYPESQVKALAAGFRDRNIPCDALYLDIDYMDGYRCFTWNRDYFPDPKRMIGELRDDGFHTVVMIDPGIAKDENYPVYQEGIEHDAFCRRGTGEHMEGPVWPPVCVWPDYTHPAVREWWGGLYHELYVEQGVSGFWNDMNEPAMFKVNHLTFPDDVRHHYEGVGGDHKKVHNVYGMQMTRATYEGLKRLRPGKRPFLLGRANFSGGQRYAALWTGDNIASWEHLALANRQSIRLSISGYSFVGSDIGGFVDDPTPELLTRWLQLSVFHPLMRIHSMGDHTDGSAEVSEETKTEGKEEQRQEPWVHGGKHTDRNREAIAFRYRLLPYLYTAFERHVRGGTPVLRNLFFYDQQDPECRKYGDQFLTGDDLLVCPIVKPGIKTLTVYLPQGQWYDYWTGKRHTGKRRLKVATHPDRLPIFVRAGAVVPTIDVVQHTAQLPELDTMHLTAFPGDKGPASELYWDAGEGYDYERGSYTRRTYTLTQDTPGALTIRQQRTGGYSTNFLWARTRVQRKFGDTVKVRCDNADVRDVEHHTSGISFRVPFDFGEILIQ